MGLMICLGSSALSQVSPEKALQTFTVADGLELRLWASEPLFSNPTCIDIDHKGRVWVCESVNYRHKLLRRPPNRPEGDRIVILEDTTGSGKADKATTFYQAPDFLAPLGIAVAKDPVGPGYKVYVCHSPDILLFEDKDGDGKADGPPKKLLSGFGGFDHDHGVHGILIGPDGKLYFSVGDQGVKDLQSSDGKGRKWTTNHTDCQAGTIWRCDLDGKNLELLAHNFRNEYEPCVDSFGSIFVSDNDDDGNEQTRICYVMPGGNYGYWPRGPGQSHWHEEQPGVVPKILRTGFGSPTGMCVYEGTLLPFPYHGQLLHTDAGPRHVRAYHLTVQFGAGYGIEREDIVQSRDNWFRPSDVCVAPDGSVFVADWYDPGVGGHGMGDTTRGRIFRLAPKGNKPAVAKVDLSSSHGIMAALGSPALSVRYMAMAQLDRMARGEALAILEPAGRQKANPVLRARALWQLARLGGSTVDSLALKTCFVDDDLRIMQLAVRLAKAYLGYTPAQFASYLKTWDGKANVPGNSLRREVLLALRDQDPRLAKELLYGLMDWYDGTDRFYLEAIGIAVGHHDKARRDIILADFDKHFPEWNDKVADLVWELRPPSVLPKLATLLSDPKLPAAQRARIVDILAASDDVQAGVDLLKLLRSDMPDDIRAGIMINLRRFVAGKWHGLRDRPELVETIDFLLAKPQKRLDGLALIAAAERTAYIKQVATLAREMDGPRDGVNSAAIRTLGALYHEDAVAALQDLVRTDPPVLAWEALKALGELARQERRGRPNPALKALQDLLGTESKQAGRISEAVVEALAGSRSGSQWLLQAHEKKELPEDLTPLAGRLLRNSPHQDLRNRALIAFPAPGKLDPKRLPSIASLVSRKGNADRGKHLLAASAKNDLQCLKCHTVRGVGGQVGPDLSMIGKKASRENLFESILLPSKAIADQYVSWVVETKNGLVLTGLLIEETPEYLLLRDANAKDTKVARADVESRTKSLTSLMPTDLLAYMTDDDLVDLVDYLLTLNTPSLSVDSWHIVGPFDNGAGDTGIDREFPPEKALDLAAVYEGKAGPVRWRTVKPDGQGYVDLAAFYAGNSANIVSYLYRDIESPADQKAQILIGTDDCAKLWVNGLLAYTNRQHRAAAPEQGTVTVRLKKGQNRLLLKINNGDGPHGFYFTILSEQELKR
jgi:putative membrane-bound dehydrogenase-like protein